MASHVLSIAGICRADRASLTASAARWIAGFQKPLLTLFGLACKKCGILAECLEQKCHQCFDTRGMAQVGVRE